MASVSPVPTKNHPSEGFTFRNGAVTGKILMFWLMGAPLGAHRFYLGQNGIGIILAVISIWTLILSWTLLSKPMILIFGAVLVVDFCELLITAVLRKPGVHSIGKGVGD